jgi:hypothetical protein
VRAIITRRKLNEEQRAAADALMDQYLSALGDFAGTPLGVAGAGQHVAKLGILHIERDNHLPCAWDIVAKFIPGPCRLALRELLAFRYSGRASSLGDDLPHHGVHGFSFVADGLGNRNDPDAMFRELSEIELLLERLSEEPAIAVNDNIIERLPAIAGAFDHLLEGRPAIISGGCARFYELGDLSVAIGAAPPPQLPALIGNRQVVFRLPAGRNAHVEGGPRRQGGTGLGAATHSKSGGSLWPNGPRSFETLPK